jgi:phage baseplate assembly protein W|tara:strand:- start:8679 stop:9119 length:441 start_codon:yes stop_codon:yes gene_type:complete
MAKERKEYFYNPIDFEQDVAVGIKLPFSKDSGLFTLSYSTEEQAVSNLKNLLLTRKGERLFQPTFGSQIYALLFEPITLDLKQKLEEGILEDVNFWLPYIIIDKVEVTPEEDKNQVGISLNFRVTEQGANNQIILYVDSAGSATIE